MTTTEIAKAFMVDFLAADVCWRRCTSAFAGDVVQRAMGKLVAEVMTVAGPERAKRLMGGMNGVSTEMIGDVADVLADPRTKKAITTYLTTVAKARAPPPGELAGCLRKTCDAGALDVNREYVRGARALLAIAGDPEVRAALDKVLTKMDRLYEGLERELAKKPAPKARK